MSVETNIPTSRGQLAYDASQPGGLSDSLFKRVRTRWQSTVDAARSVREAVGGSAPTFKPDSFNRELSPDDWEITSQENELIEACTAKVLEELNQALEGMQGYVTLSWESEGGHTAAIFRDPIALMGKGRAAAVAELNQVVSEVIGEYSVRTFGGWEAPGRTLDNRDNQLQPTISERIFDDGSDYIQTIRIASLTKPTNIAVIKSWFRSPVTLRIDIIPKDNLGAYNQYDSPYRDQIPQAALMDSAVADDEDVTVEAAPVIDFMPEATKLVVKWLKDSRKVLSRETQNAQALTDTGNVSPYLEKYLLLECSKLEEALQQAHDIEANASITAAEVLYLRLVAIFKSMITAEGRNKLKTLGIPISSDLTSMLEKLLPLADVDKAILGRVRPAQLERLLENDIPKSLAFWLKTRAQAVAETRVANYLAKPLKLIDTKLSEAEQAKQLTEQQTYLFGESGKYTFKTYWGFTERAVPSEAELLAIYEAAGEVFFPLDVTTTAAQLETWQQQVTDYAVAEDYQQKVAKKEIGDQKLRELAKQVATLIQRTIIEPDLLRELKLEGIDWNEPVTALEAFGKVRQEKGALLSKIIVSSGKNNQERTNLSQELTTLFETLDGEDVKNLLTLVKQDPLPKQFDNQFWQFISTNTVAAFLKFWQTNGQALTGIARKKPIVEAFLKQRQALVTEHDDNYQAYLTQLLAEIDAKKDAFRKTLVAKLKKSKVDYATARANAIIDQINTANLLETVLSIQEHVGWLGDHSIAAINEEISTTVNQTLRLSGVSAPLRLPWYGPAKTEAETRAEILENKAKSESLKLIATPPELPKAQAAPIKTTQPGAVPNPFFRRPEATVTHTPTIDVLPAVIDDSDSEDAPVSLFKRLTSPTTAPTAKTTGTTPEHDLENELEEYFRQQAEARQRTEQAYFGDADEFDDDAPPLTPEQLARIKAYANSENAAVAERAKLAKNT